MLRALIIRPAKFVKTRSMSVSSSREGRKFEGKVAIVTASTDGLALVSVALYKGGTLSQCERVPLPSVLQYWVCYSRQAGAGWGYGDGEQS